MNPPSSPHDLGLYDQFMSLLPRSCFHVDWTNTVTPQTFIRRTQLTHSSPVDSVAAALDLQSLTYFGEKYLWGPQTDWTATCQELMCEWIRSTRHASEISRLHSVFALETEAEAKAFCARYNLLQAKIYLVLAVDYSDRKDTNWFARSGTVMERMHFIDEYWTGKPANEKPLWEFLLHPAVYVERQV